MYVSSALHTKYVRVSLCVDLTKKFNAKPNKRGLWYGDNISNVYSIEREKPSCFKSSDKLGVSPQRTTSFSPTKLWQRPNLIDNFW